MSGQSGFDLKVFGPFGAMLGPFFSGLESFAQNGRAAGTGTQDVTAQASRSVKVAGRCQLEVMGLMNRRAQAYMQIPTRLSQCRTPQDLIEAQLEFWQTAFGQYSSTSRRVTELAVEMVPVGFAGMEPSRRERDYINFNSGKDEPQPAQQQRSGQQRRVA